MYKLVNGADGVTPVFVKLNNSFIPFDPANTDYQTFKTKVLSDEAQLENADGVLMTQDEAKAFVATLP